MTGRRSWGDYYQGALGIDYFLEHLAIHKVFLKEILSSGPRTTLEAGCGSAVMSVFLAMAGVRATACDRDEEVLRTARANAEAWKSVLELKREDILNMSFANDSFDVVFSQGVLEHLTDDQIRQACAEALRVGKIFVFSVPGHHYRHKDFGDERLLSPQEWSRILSGTGKVRLTPYFELRTKRNWLRKRPLMLMGTVCR